LSFRKRGTSCPTATTPSPTYRPYWEQYLTGTGAASWSGDGLRLSTHTASATVYSDAQLDDYHGLRRRDMPWRPPLTLELRARFSHAEGRLGGTAGFGFWNHPILLPSNPVPALPRAIWFFYASPPQICSSIC